MFDEGRQKRFSNQLKPIPKKVVIGGLGEDEYSKVPTKNELYEARAAEVEAEIQRKMNEKTLKINQNIIEINEKSIENKGAPTKNR